MGYLYRGIVFAAMLAIMLSAPAHSIGLGSIGLRVGMDLAQNQVNYTSGSQFDSARLFLGGHVDVGSIFITKLHLVPGLDLVMEDNLKVYSINTETRYYFTNGEKAAGYAGGGIGVHLFRYDVAPTDVAIDRTKFSLNIPVGFQRRVGQGLQWFGEVKLVIADDEVDSSFRFSLGLLVDLGL